MQENLDVRWASRTGGAFGRRGTTELQVIGVSQSHASDWELQDVLRNCRCAHDD